MKLREALAFEIPTGGDAHEPWRRCIDTFLDSPEDICAWSQAKAVEGATYTVQPRSVVLLVARSDNGETL